MELGVKSEKGEGAISEPRPDIQELFSHYNSLYFEGALSGCSVYWTDSRAARAAGMCCFVEGGRCEIRLSEPLLKFRSTADLKNTLLHEMIHAFLYVMSNRKDHRYHGPSFVAIVNEIHSSSKTDPQRPPDGYNITLFHDFSKEVDSSGVGQWTCTSCGDTIEGPVNRKPSANDCIENMANGNSCGNLSCHWHRHKTLCSGTYKKSTVKGGCKGKMKVPKAAKENEEDKTKGPSSKTKQMNKRSDNVVQTKELSNVQSMADDSVTSSGIESSPCNINCSQRNTSKKQPKAAPLKTADSTSASKIPKRPRITASTEGHKQASPEKAKSPARKVELAKAGLWFAFDGDEELALDEDVKPLTNKRTKRRAMEKRAKLKEGSDAQAVVAACSSKCGEANRGMDRRIPHDTRPPLREEVIYIMDD